MVVLHEVEEIFRLQLRYRIVMEKQGGYKRIFVHNHRPKSGLIGLHPALIVLLNQALLQQQLLTKIHAEVHNMIFIIVT